MSEYDPRDFKVDLQDVKGAWILLILINIGLVLL